MAIYRIKRFSVTYDKHKDRYSGKYSMGQRIGSLAVHSGLGAAAGFALGSLTGNKRAAVTLAKAGSILGAGASLYNTRNSRIEKYNKTRDERDNQSRLDSLERRKKSLPLSYSDFRKKYPDQYNKLKSLGDLGYFTDENPGDIDWFEQGGLEKGRYLPISRPDDYNNLMFDLRKREFVNIDSELLEPTPVKDIKEWAKFIKSCIQQ